MTAKTILILANSRKKSGRCIAGKEIEDGYFQSWVRPVPNRDSTEFWHSEAHLYDMYRQPDVLEFVTVALEGPRPKACHVENWVIDPAYSLSFERSASYDQALLAVDSPPSLWDRHSSTRHGLNDEIEESHATQNGYSIVLIKVDAVELVVIDKAFQSLQPQLALQARFVYNGLKYWLWVTDPVFEARYTTNKGDSYSFGECLLTISLSEAMTKTNRFGSYQFKVVAAIIAKP